jgi:hypothetical protein
MKILFAKAKKVEEKNKGCKKGGVSKLSPAPRRSENEQAR